MALHQAIAGNEIVEEQIQTITVQENMILIIMMMMMMVMVVMIKTRIIMKVILIIKRMMMTMTMTYQVSSPPVIHFHRITKGVSDRPISENLCFQKVLKQYLDLSCTHR